jgi:AraC-like DNA-binding protein
MSHTFDMAGRYLTGFPSRYRMVLIKLFLPADLEPSRYAAKQIELRSILDPVLPSNSIIHFSANLVVIILPCGYLDDREECETMLGTWCEQLTADADLDVRMAVSAAGSGLQQLSEFFHQLQNLLRLTDHLSQPRPQFMEDQKPILVLPDHGKQHSTYFYEHIIRGQPDMALNLLREDIELLRQSGYVHEADVQQLFFAYRHALAMALVLLDDAEATGIELPQYETKDNLDDTFAGIASGLEQISQVFQNRQQSNTESFERTVLAMIDESLANPDLYIRMVTEHFAISESTLQRTMHKATGKSFFEYVDLKRMTRARELLSKTDQPINQVMAQCGYTTLNTFYKAFKRRYGMSPTAMRESKRLTD